MDYKYGGSNGFFANGGAPIEVNSGLGRAFGMIDTAQDIRMYIRYRY